MNLMRAVTATMVAALLATPAGLAQQQAPQRAGTVAEGVRAVLVDVVVRDKRGLPVRDLAETDFELLEDGVRQKIGSFTPFFEGAPPAVTSTGSTTTTATTTTTTTTSVPVIQGPIVTALVFDRLSPEA